MYSEAPENMTTEQQVVVELLAVSSRKELIVTDGRRGKKGRTVVAFDRIFVFLKYVIRLAIYLIRFSHPFSYNKLKVGVAVKEKERVGWIVRVV